MQTIKLIDLGTKDYKETWDYQEELSNEVVKAQHKDPQGASVGYLVLVEHPHVYTLGKSGEADNLLINDEFMKQIGATFYKTNRGGDITYHGPGQIVGYPIVDLGKLGIGIREYIDKMEQSIIETLKEFKIVATRFDGATGVWLDVDTPKARKICAIGVRVSRQVTMHGFALNVNTNLNYFSYINPCGFQDKGATSIQKEHNELKDIAQAKKIVAQKFADQYGLKIE